MVEYTYTDLFTKQFEQEEEQTKKGVMRPNAKVEPPKQDFMLSFVDVLKGYAGEGADKVLAPKKKEFDIDAFYKEFDDLTLRSAEEAALQRMESGISRSLTKEEAQIRGITKDPLYGNMLPASPLPKGIEEPSPVTEEELPPAETSGGLMSPRLDQKGKTPLSELQKYTTDYAETYLTQHEGLKAHKSLEGGKDTAALGVKFSLGLKRKDYSSDAEFAAAVALKHRDKAKAKFKEADWEALPDSVKYAIVDLNYNTGTIGSTANKDSTVNMMKNTLDFIGMTTKAGDKASLVSLAKRRAWNWNKAADDIGESKITKIKQIPTDSGGTTFEYLDKDGNVVHSLTTSRKPVKLSSDGTATTLTETREITL